MHKTNKFWLFVLVVLGFIMVSMATMGSLFWQQLPPEEKYQFINLVERHVAFIFFIIFFIIAGYGFLLDWFFRLYVIPMDKLREETEIIYTINPSHRLEPKGAEEIQQLCLVINKGADLIDAQQSKVQAMIQKAMAETETETTILAAVMAELPEGVLICNRDGKILLYNNRARALLAGSGSTVRSMTNNLSSDPRLSEWNTSFIGLGRSVFSIINKNLVLHALEEIFEKLDHEEEEVASYFVISEDDKTLLNVETVPILDATKKFTGFVMIIYDITQQMNETRKAEALVHTLTTGIRPPLASIQAAIESILHYPDMDPGKQERFKTIIHNEVLTIARTLDKATSEQASALNRWPLVNMLACHLMRTIRAKAGEKLGIALEINDCVDDPWVNVDSYSMTLALLFILSSLKSKTKVDTFNCTVDQQEKIVYIDLFWLGEPIPPEELSRWEQLPLTVKDDSISLTLKEVKLRHGCEFISHRDDASTQGACFRILFPAVKAPPPSKTLRNLTILPENRPGYYEFDLFSPSEKITQLDNYLLTELPMTVFDTETTGLSPDEDEIISIAAVRIINGRLLHKEFFNQLVNPEMPLPPASIKFHGIQPEMLKDKPFIGEVLPLFHRFCEGTVLVAHNAAFDMKMLQVKEASTGIRFTNPVLDTLLLSTFLHPAHTNHDIEAIAIRLGINLLRRHSAYGDAVMTAEILLKLIPILAQQGVHTLKQAIEASKTSYYARLKY